jgi:glycosyltransferase involved in cell wall biosynthesis
VVRAPASSSRRSRRCRFPQPPRGRALPCPSAPVRFGWWGVGAPHKGLGDVLAAYAELVGGGGIDAELHVFGPIPDHALAADLEARAHALPGIHRHGPFAFEDLERADLDVAVLPSRAFETWGLSLDEAVALDLPAIVSAVGAPAARLGDGVATVPPGDIPALVRAMRALATDAALGLDQLAARRELVRRLPAAPPLDAVLADTYERVVREGVALAPGMLAELDELDRRSAALDELQRASLGRHDGPLGSPR